MAVEHNIVIGGGLAGARATEGMREAGFDGAITLVGAENVLPYERPALSKEVLTGAKPPESTRVFDQGWYADHDVDLRLGTRVVGLDTAAREVVLSDGGRLGYSRALIATGSQPRRLDLGDAGDPRVHYLRRLEDAAALKARLAAGGRIAIIGAGWIGMEVAAAARGFGVEVVMFERGEIPLAGAVGPEIGRVFAQIHIDHGVELATRCSIERTTFRDDAIEILDSRGMVYMVDAVVVGVGAELDLAFASDSGVPVDRGVQVDAALKSSVDGIYAAGDAANAFHPLYGRHLHLEHWANAKNQGYAAGFSMAGDSVSYDRIPYFYTDQYDLSMEFSGLVAAESHDRLVYRGSVADLEFIAFWLDGDRVVAGMNVNVWDVVEDIQRLIRSGARASEARLADTAVPLGEM